MTENVFVDGLEKLTMLGGAARMEFYALLPSPQGAEGHPTVAPRLRLVMAPETLVQLHAAMRDLVQQFVARGILRPVDPAPAEARMPEVVDG